VEATIPESTPPSGLSTGHVGINVTDLDRAVAFYTGALGLTVRGQAPPGERRYAFLGTAERTLLTVWQQSTDRFADDRPGLHHLAFQVDTIDDVLAVERRVRDAGAELIYDTIVPHREGAADGGLYFRDPDGTRLEVYALTGADEHGDAPTPGAPSCGFF